MNGTGHLKVSAGPTLTVPGATASESVIVEAAVSKAATVVPAAIPVPVTLIPTRIPSTLVIGTTMPGLVALGGLPSMPVTAPFVLAVNVGAAAVGSVTTVPRVLGANETTVPAGT